MLESQKAQMEEQERQRLGLIQETKDANQLLKTQAEQLKKRYGKQTDRNRRNTR